LDERVSELHNLRPEWDVISLGEDETVFTYHPGSSHTASRSCLLWSILSKCLADPRSFIDSVLQVRNTTERESQVGYQMW